MLENFQEMKNPFNDFLREYDVVRYIKHCLSIPFIYAVFFPAVIMDVFVSLYNQVAFPLYGVPVVDRSKYVVFDRKHLRYLGLVQRLNCWYCSYLNGLFSYFVEVGARTELYWCPIKSVSRPVAPHRLYDGFAAYGDPAQWEKKNHSTEVTDATCVPRAPVRK
ncbi:MAG: hypothetical protein HGA33_06200 [Candidatus Moranbacteria bacterium]|nr:hypothetical protein [Candidatus Moranbacteria bacterium]